MRAKEHDSEAASSLKGTQNQPPHRTAAATAAAAGRGPRVTRPARAPTPSPPPSPALQHDALLHGPQHWSKHGRNRGAGDAAGMVRARSKVHSSTRAFVGSGRFPERYQRNYSTTLWFPFQDD